MTITPGQRIAGVAIDHENREENDFYPTPPEATRSLLRVEKFTGTIWEPACGDGAISKVLEAANLTVISTDLIDRGYGTGGRDFMMEWKSLAPNIVTNPPFTMTQEFIERAVMISTCKVALLMRLQCLAGQERKLFYDRHPPARVWVLSNRIKMLRGGIELREDQSGGMYDFAWFVWYHGYRGSTKLGWLNTKEA
jgi:hypothetical protein